MLFFAGDQTYHHTEHTAGWIEFGLQFRDLIKDRPTVTIPDDHDVGQANLWGESGIVATSPAGNSGGYFYPIPMSIWFNVSKPGTYPIRWILKR